MKPGPPELQCRCYKRAKENIQTFKLISKVEAHHLFNNGLHSQSKHNTHKTEHKSVTLQGNHAIWKLQWSDLWYITFLQHMELMSFCCAAIIEPWYKVDLKINWKLYPCSPTAQSTLKKKKVVWTHETKLKLHGKSYRLLNKIAPTCSETWN